jgi:hypothetical protein
MSTPYWPLTLSYGMFGDPTSRLMFASLDHWLAYHMLARREDRERVMRTPNGFLAWTTLRRILQESQGRGGNPAVSSRWEEDRDRVMAEGLRLKFGQSEFLRGMLLRTGDRDIVDDSRHEEEYWCRAGGNGQNRHGVALMSLRVELSQGLR